MWYRAARRLPKDFILMILNLFLGRPRPSQPQLPVLFNSFMRRSPVKLLKHERQFCAAALSVLVQNYFALRNAIVPSNEPEVTPVTMLTSRSRVKLPVAPAK